MNQNDSVDLENFKILRSIWKNTYDKILEIKVANRRSWNQTKMNILDEEKKKIDTKYDKEYNEQYIENKIQISEARNGSNLNKMRKRNELMEKLSQEALERTQQFAKPTNPDYKKLVKQLIIQGMVKMLESSVYVVVRNCDESFVRGMLKECENEFASIMKNETERDYSCSLEIDPKAHLETER